MEFRFLHTADIHLDSPLVGLESYPDAPVDEIRGASRRAFDNLISCALAEKVAFVLIAGDLFDGDWKDFNTALFFVNRMGQLQRAGIEVFIIKGNHDAVSQISKTIPLPANVHVFPAEKPTTFSLEHLNVFLHGQSYSGRVVGNLAIGYPKAIASACNIGLLHTSLTGREGHEPYAPCSIAELESKGYEYWALGHIHTREIVNQSPWIVFPGNLQGRSVRETGNKGASLVQVLDGHVASVDHLELDVLRWEKVEVGASACHNHNEFYDEVTAVIEQLAEQAQVIPLAVRLTVSGSSPLHPQFISHEQKWIDDIRGIAAARGSLWLEKILFATTDRQTEHPAQDHPLFELNQCIHEYPVSPDDLPAMIAEFSSLRAMLPAEAAELSLQEDQLIELIQDTRRFLLARLLDRGTA